MKFEVYKRANQYGKRYYFRLVGGNHEPIMYSEPYTSPQARDAGIEAIRRAADAPVVEVTR